MIEGVDLLWLVGIILILLVFGFIGWILYGLVLLCKFFLFLIKAVVYLIALFISWLKGEDF